MKESLVEFNQVSFSFKNQNVLDNFSFSIPGNQWLAMVGVNGAGKSTLLKLALGLLKPNDGHVKVLGQPAGEFSTKPDVGSALQDVDFPNSEKVEEVLQFVCDQYPKSVAIKELIEVFQLHEFSKKSCGQLSGGMKRRLALACAFAGQPKIVFLDEPTTGLDQGSRKHLMATLKTYQKKYQCLILMISHHPEEAMNSVDGFLHLKDRGIVRLSTDNMRQSMALRKIQFQLNQSVKLPSARKVKQDDGRVEIVTAESDQYLNKLVEQKIPFKNLTVDKLTVEELLGEFL